MDNAAEALSRVPFFADLSRRDLKRLAALCVPKEFEAGTEILKEGALGLGLFLISEGRVEVFKTENERRRKLAVLGAGDVLGEMALIDDKPRSASAVALEPTSALLLSRDSFRTVVKKSPAVAWALVPELAGRLRNVEDRLMAAEGEAEETAARSAKTTGRSKEAAGRDDEAAGDEPAPESHGDGSDAEHAGWAGSRLLFAQYALMMSGLDGLGGSLRVCRSFLRTLAEATEVGRDEELLKVLLKLPRGAVDAAVTSLAEAGKIPVDMMDSLLRHLNDRDGDRGDE